jgi:hypothetical protein
MMTVTWEVRRKFIGWKTVYSCSGTDHQACYRSALKVMNERNKGFGKLFKWELRGK